MFVSRLRAAIGVAFAQLRHERTRTLIAIFGVALAVLGATLLASVGLGVVQTGQEKFSSAGRDLWVSGGPIQFAPGTPGGFENSVVDAHGVEAKLEQRSDVRSANPLIFQTVYASRDAGSFETLVGVGAATSGPSVSFVEGGGIEKGDVHYADGTYEGPMLHEVVVDERVAAMYDLSVGDTIYIGGTIADARRNEFTVVGISNTYSSFVGAPTVVLPPSELQEVTGTTGSDRATFVSVQLTDDADPETTAAELREEFPRYEIRTNRQQMAAILQDKAVVIASGASLVLLAIAAGLALTLNLQLSLVFQQREQLAAIQAIGVSQGTLLWSVLTRSLVIGVLGGLLGVGLTVPGVYGVNAAAEFVTGFEGLVEVSRRVLLGGFVVAVAMSLLSVVVVGVALLRSTATARLPR
jgi:putative ABC transport system permease protein